jgi:hypothetical protein
MLLQRNTLRNPKTFFLGEGACQLFTDSHFSCSMGNLTLAQREGWLYISSNTRWNNARLVCNKTTRFFIILKARNKDL